MAEGEAAEWALEAAGPSLWRVNGALYREADEGELPDRFGHAVLDQFRTACTNGFVGVVSLESAFLHKPHRRPQCFPHGEMGGCGCRSLLLRRLQAPSDA